MKNTNKKEVKKIKSPTEMLITKILIWVLLGAMVIIPVVSLVILLRSAF
ncbi:MAG: hypothetical protein R3Y60_00055 [bacterium]